MTKQQNLHRAGLSAVADLERLIDRLKEAGPCPLDGRNALMNLHELIKVLLYRFPPDMPQPNRFTDAPPRGNWNTDMSAAPKGFEADDRSRYFLAWCPDMVGMFTAETGICICWWEAGINGGTWYGEGDFPLNPTHWQPLPPPPATGER